MLKKLLAGLLAVCCVPVCGLTAAAKRLPLWYGETKWDAFEGEEPINDRGMLTGEDGLLYEALRYESEAFVYLLQPRRNLIKFYPQEDADIDAVAMQVAEVLDAYFPGMKDSLNEEAYQKYGRLEFQTEAAILDGGESYTNASGEKVRIFDGFSLMLLQNPLPENAAALEANILRDLAKKHLITAFYGFGGTAMYSECYFNAEPLSGISLKDGPLTEQDAERIQAYLDEQHPGYQIERFSSLNEPLTFPSLHQDRDQEYRITGAEALSFREKIELGGELYEQCGVILTAVSPCADEKSTLGRNLLAKQGDVTLDTELTIVDVIALNKNLMTGEPLCDTAKKNADINGNGTPDEADSLAILKEIIELTHDFEEPEKG